MVDTIPQIYPISAMRQRQNEILAAVSHGPVVLAQRSKGVAVLVSLDMWNRLIQELEDLQDALDAIMIRQRIAAGEEEVYDWETVKAELDAERVSA